MPRPFPGQSDDPLYQAKQLEQNWQFLVRVRGCFVSLRRSRACLDDESTGGWNKFSAGGRHHGFWSGPARFCFFSSPLPIHPRRQKSPNIPTATTIMITQTV